MFCCFFSVFVGGFTTFFVVVHFLRSMIVGLYFLFFVVYFFYFFCLLLSCATLIWFGVCLFGFVLLFVCLLFVYYFLFVTFLLSFVCFLLACSCLSAFFFLCAFVLVLLVCLLLFFVCFLFHDFFLLDYFGFVRSFAFVRSFVRSFACLLVCCWLLLLFVRFFPVLYFYLFVVSPSFCSFTIGLVAFVCVLSFVCFRLCDFVRLYFLFLIFSCVCSLPLRACVCTCTDWCFTSSPLCVYERVVVFWSCARGCHILAFLCSWSSCPRVVLVCSRCSYS